jgi:quinohemoprotein ethanol dehydrogenase
VVPVEPSAFGAHNWHPMSFSPKTGLVYIPAQATGGAFKKEEDFKIKPGAWNLGIDLDQFSGLNRQTAGAGHLLAWDPVRQKPAWRVQHRFLWNGGTLATAGNLVFQGTSDMRFAAYSADKGKMLWEVSVESGIIAGPMTYMLDGVQYVTVNAGWGGAFALIGGDAALATGSRPGGAVMTYALASKMPAVAVAPVDPEAVKGGVLYHSHCAVCHGAGGISGGLIPDLRHSSEDVKKNLPIIIKNGIPGTGMAPFGKWISEEEAKLIEKYVRARTAEEEAGRF